MATMMTIDAARACASAARASAARGGYRCRRDGQRMMMTTTSVAWRDGRASVRARAAEESRDDANGGDDEDEGSDSALSSSFADELARRGGGAKASGTPSNPFEKLGAAANAPPRFAPSKADRRPVDDGDQLARSRALQSEGLAGFPARAEQLIKLGFATFLGFGPFIAAISVVFCLTYFLFGSDFIHSGEGYGTPAFVPAEVLLAEPTVDRMVPFAQYVDQP